MTVETRVRGNLVPKGDTTSYEETLKRGDGVPFKLLDAAARDPESRSEIRREVSSYWIVSSSLGVYPGQGRKEGVPKEMRAGTSFKDAYGFGDGRKVLLDGGSITDALAEKVAQAAGRPFVYFNHIAPDQFSVSSRGHLVFAPDPAAAEVAGNLPWRGGLTASLEPILGGGQRYVILYDDAKANRVGLLARNFDDAVGRQIVVAYVRPGNAGFGVVARAAEGREAAAPQISVSGGITAEIYRLAIATEAEVTRFGTVGENELQAALQLSRDVKAAYRQQ